MSILFSTQQRLTEDEIRADLINPALAGDSEAIGETGRQYLDKKQYGEAMKWFRLAAAKNNSGAQNDIGVMYYKELGVPSNYVAAMEWFLKAATQESEKAYENIGGLFEYGIGVSVNEYKALEWYFKSEEKSDKIKKLTEKGIQLTVQDKEKSIAQLIVETEDIAWELRNNEENEVENEVEEIKTLKQKKSQLQEELSKKPVEIMKKELEKKEKILRDQQKVSYKDKQELIEEIHYQEEKIKSLVQQIKSKADEIENLESLGRRNRSEQ